MSYHERMRTVEFCVEHVNGRVPVIAGSGSNATENAMTLSRDAERAGADGLLLVTPYYNKANKSGMLAHFQAVADAVSIPILLYNVPSRTGCSIPLDVLAQLAKHPHIVGIKEASGDIAYVTNCAKLLCEDFCMLSGNDDMIVPLLSLGGSGVISVLANVAPAQTHELVDAYLSGDVAHSRALQLDYLELIHALFIETNPAPVKEAMNLLGMPVGPCRLPLGPMAPQNIETLKNALKILQ